ncbi:head completion/stabilization protein [Moraxella sp. ZY210820]|uniref:head completion/stabilization protein n=1 Tax=unclassified Moraxella TaxID=2685852 RepID=UPI002730185F|nr:head completion/stabilization protein [Moraxella sp. ZY210820]WLF84480.1 head completion/stabilization protein [Moraxella sp. ZY210820]
MLINQQPIDKVIENPRLGYPSLSVKELLNTVRLDESKGEALLSEKILLAMIEINGQLLDKNFIQNPLNDEQTVLYKTAVCYECSALIAEDNLDFDTTSTGQIRGENGLSKIGSLRRIVSNRIADLTGRKRNRVRLI